MSSETNKMMARRFFEEVFNGGKLDAVSDIFAPNHVIEGPGALPGLPRGPEGMHKFVSFYRHAFPDTHFTIDEQVAEGDTVVTRWTAQGTQTGEMSGMGIPVTGRPVTVTGMTVDRIKNGKIVETWAVFDQFSMLQQLGVIPPASKSQST